MPQLLPYFTTPNANNATKTNLRVCLVLHPHAAQLASELSAAVRGRQYHLATDLQAQALAWKEWGEMVEFLANSLCGGDTQRCAAARSVGGLLALLAKGGVTDMAKLCKCQQKDLRELGERNEQFQDEPVFLACPRPSLPTSTKPGRTTRNPQLRVRC